MTSYITRSKLYDNIRLVCGVTSIDKGRDVGKMLHPMLNIPQPPTGLSIYNKTFGSAVADVSESSMMQAVIEAVADNAEDVPSLSCLFWWQLAKTWTHFPDRHYNSYVL